MELPPLILGTPVMLMASVMFRQQNQLVYVMEIFGTILVMVLVKLLPSMQRIKLLEYGIKNHLLQMEEPLIVVGG